MVQIDAVKRLHHRLCESNPYELVEARSGTARAICDICVRHDLFLFIRLDTNLLIAGRLSIPGDGEHLDWLVSEVANRKGRRLFGLLLLLGNLSVQAHLVISCRFAHI